MPRGVAPAAPASARKHGVSAVTASANSFSREWIHERGLSVALRGGDVASALPNFIFSDKRCLNYP